MSESKVRTGDNVKKTPSKEPKEQTVDAQKKTPQDNEKEQKPDKREKTTVEEAFVAHNVFPEPSAAFSFIPPPISGIHKTCAVVLDTNVLLLPYRAGASSLEQIKIVFTQLSKDKRLFVPGQVAREFARNRPQHIAELYKAISDRSSRVLSPEKIAYPLLEGIPEYTALTNAVSALEEPRKLYQAAVNGLLNRIKEWQWSDPVSLAYKDIFVNQCICDPSIDKEVTLQEMERRYSAKIPPGYKDGNKDDGGIGDYLIWLTILNIGSRQKKPLIFVTGEEKADWQHRSASQGILPRYELVDEYRRASGNQPFYILSFSDLLELFNAPKTTVDEIRTEESKSRELLPVQVNCPYCGSQVECAIDIIVGSSAAPVCPNCKTRFHVNRASEGIIVNPFGGRSQRRPFSINEPLNAKLSEIARRIVELRDSEEVILSNSTATSGMDLNDHVLSTYRCSLCGAPFRGTDRRVNENGIICNECLGQRDIDVFG